MVHENPIARAYFESHVGVKTFQNLSNARQVVYLPFGNVHPPMFGLLARAQLRPEVSGQREFSMIQCRRLPNHQFRHLDVLIDLAE
jgi:hypothetical protein